MPGASPHDYVRHGATTLFAALDIARRAQCSPSANRPTASRSSAASYAISTSRYRAGLDPHLIV